MRLYQRQHHTIISIHALHEESDQYAQQSADWGYQFQSTLSMRRATYFMTRNSNTGVISIHALHEESDEGLG